MYAREETVIESGNVVRVPTYCQDKSYFKEHAYFGMHNGRGQWYCRNTTGEYDVHHIKYQVAPAMEYEALTKHADGCETLGAFNVEGRILATDKAPTLAVRNTSNYPKVIASGTPRRNNSIMQRKYFGL